MKVISILDLAENEIGDLGICEIVTALKNFSLIEDIDLSCNAIGKTSFFKDCAEALSLLLTENKNLEHLKLNWNNIRGVPGEKIITAIKTCYALKSVFLANNLLGVAYEGIEPPVNIFCDVLMSS